MTFPRFSEAPPLPRVVELQNQEIWFVGGVLGLAFLFWLTLSFVRKRRKKLERDGVFRKYHLPEDEFS